MDIYHPVSLVTQYLNHDVDSLQRVLVGIGEAFNLNPILLLPPIIVLACAIKKFPPLPTLILSALLASVLAIIVQSQVLDNVIQSLYKGFDVAMLSSQTSLPESIGVLFNRGGLYALSEPVIITLMVFVFVGSLDCRKVIPSLLNNILLNVKSKASLVLTTLVSSALSNAMTSSQYANSFIVGEAFAKKYDQKNIPRTVLSRSLEDTGTMIESLVPWSTTAVFIYATLGVAAQEYWYWQFLSLANIVLAIIFAVFCVGMSGNDESEVVFDGKFTPY